MEEKWERKVQQPPLEYSYHIWQRPPYYNLQSKSKKRGGMPKSVILGYKRGTREPVILSEESRSLSLYVIGTPGTGKSLTLENIAWQDMCNGGGLLFLDPHGESADRLLLSVPQERRDDIVFWCPRDYKHALGLNPFQCDPNDPVAVSTRAQSFVSALESLGEFSEVFAQGVRMKEVLLNLAFAFIYNQGYSLLETIRFISVDDNGVAYRKAFYPKLSEYNPEVRLFWEEYDALKYVTARREVTGAAANKLRRFTSDPIMKGIFSKTSNSINFREAIDTGKVIILKLSDIGRYNAAFIGAFVIWEVWQTTLLRGKSAAVRPFHIIADEFETYMTLAFPEIQNQGRGFKLDATIAHQERSGLGEKLFGSTLSVKNRIVFQTSGRDAAELAREFKKEKEAARTHEQQKYVYVTDLLDHLKSRGHERETVVALYRALLEEIARVFSYARFEREHEERRHAAARAQEVQLAPLRSGFTQELTASQKLLEREIDGLLYRAMTLPREDTPTSLWASGGASEARFVGVVEVFYANLFSVADRAAVERVRRRENPAILQELGEGCLPARLVHILQRRTQDRDEGFLWKRTDMLWRWECAMRCLLFQLSKELHEAPCFVRSGQLESIAERERPMRDIQDELADALASQPFGVALVSLMEGTTPAQYVVDIKPMVALVENASAEAVAQAEYIIERSRKLAQQTGMPNAVLTVIAEERAEYKPVTMSEPHTPPEDEERIRTLRDEDEDEDDPILRVPVD